MTAAGGIVDGVQQLRIVFAHRNRILLTVISRVGGPFIHDGVVRVLLLPGASRVAKSPMTPVICPAFSAARALATSS